MMSGEVMPLEEARTDRLRLVPFGDIKPSTARGYTIKGLLPREGIAVVWGPPKCGKSFWIFDAAMHVALAREYRGRRVQAGPVVYLAAEGAHGFQARVEAFRQHCMAEDAEVATVPFFLVPARVDLTHDHARLIGAIEAANAAPVVIVIDTLNRTFTGSESSDQDMTAYIAAADAIRERFACCVVIVHHCGVEGTRPRGHTSLSGAVDAQIAIAKAADSGGTATVELMKDGPEGDVIGFKLKTVEVGLDADDEPITSCVVVEADATATRSASRLNNRQRRALDVLNDLAVDVGKPAPDEKHYPPGATVAPVEAWRENLFKAGVLDHDAKNPRADFKRLRESLQTRGVVGEWDGLMWAVRKPKV
jgi:hypothetical protein